MKRIGFTLIELLVVIAVSAILISILVPALYASRQQAKAIACGSNLKQLSLALTMYEQENGTFPHGFDDHCRVTPSGGYVGNAAFDLQGWWWFQFLGGIPGENFDERIILRCPSRSVRDLGLKENVLCGNYGVNRAICKDALGITGTMGSEFVGISLGLLQIRRPAETLLITDSGYSLISWRGATNAPGQPFENARRESAFYIPGLWINKERFLSPGHERDAINGRHPNKSVNVGFADGHISRVEADDLFVEDTNGGYNNRSTLWLLK